MSHLINISIDDISPHPHTPTTKVLQRCYGLIKEFSNIKFTLFIPMAYARKDEDGVYRLNEYPEFCKQLLILSEENFELGWHGFFHAQWKFVFCSFIKIISNKNEFLDLRFEQAYSIFEIMFDIAEKAGLKERMKPIFRPPGWGMSPEAIEASIAAGIKILALSHKPNIQKFYQKKDQYFNRDKNRKVIYYDCSPPEDPLVLRDKTEIVYHACDWSKNYFNEKNVNELNNFLKNNKNKIEFRFMGEF